MKTINFPTKLLFIILLIIIILIIVFFIILKKEKLLPKSEGEIRKEISEIIKGIEEDKTDIISGERIGEWRQKGDEIKKMGQNAINPLLEQITSQDLRVRWFALAQLIDLVYEADAASKEKIIEGLNVLIKKETNTTLKMQAAVGLMSLGEKTNIPIIIDCLSKKEVMSFSTPPALLSYFCLGYLKFYTGQDFQYNQTKWQSWWQENKDKLTWNLQDKKYFTK